MRDILRTSCLRPLCFPLSRSPPPSTATAARRRGRAVTSSYTTWQPVVPHIMHGSEPLSMPLAGEASPPTDPARPALMLLVASAFELMAAVVLCSTGTCDGLNAYAVSVGAVSTCLSIAVLAALRHDDAFPSVVLDLLPHTAAFLLVWWLFGWLVLTFVRPFAGLCNGFFACWAALVAAIWLVRRWLGLGLWLG